MSRTEPDLPDLPRPLSESGEEAGEVTRVARAAVTWIPRILRRQPALMLSIGYLLLTLIGMGYQFNLFFHFGVNILDYAELSDFLIAAIRTPVVILLALLTIPVALVARYLDDRLKRRFPVFKKGDRPAITVGSYVFLIVVYFFYFSMLWSERVAESIRAGDGLQVILERNYGASAAPIRTAMIGKTSGYLFFFDEAEGRVFIVPAANVATITPLPREDEDG